jgi:hypothetical protein
VDKTLNYHWESIMAREKQECHFGQKAVPTVYQSIFIGSIAGAVEVLADHPLWTIKTRLQQGKSFTLNPSVLYRGMLPNIASMAPITALQVGLDSLVRKVLFKDADLSDKQRMASAFIAGVGSSLVSCPTEMIMTRQGTMVSSFYTAANYLYQSGGLRWVYQGLPATALREGGFTMFFLAGIPMLKSKVMPYCPNDAVATLCSGIGAGVGATLASQAFDTIKTVQQTATSPIKAVEAVTNIYSTHGVYGFFKGSIPRGARVVSAVTIMGAVKEKLEEYCGSDNESDPAPKMK